MARKKKPWLFLCRCGPNIAEAIDLDRVASAIGSTMEVASVETHDILCSPDGQQWLQRRLRRGGLHPVVVAGCSPREHLETFRGVCREAGRNPHLLAMANIREQCGWVTPDRTAATDKAIRLVRAAIRRATLLEPLEEQQVDCNPDVLIIGSGVAGLQAARLLAGAGRHVILVERSPSIGGRGPRLADLYPEMECASCVLEGLLDEVLHHPLVEVLTCAELTRLAGAHGQFSATIRRAPRGVDEAACFGCPQCIEACPVSAPSELEEGLATRRAIYLSYPGALPNVPVVDRSTCLHFRGDPCDACARACPFGAIDLDQTETFVTREVGAVLVATGAELADLASTWGPDLPGVYTTMALERMLNSSGPTAGKVLLPDGRRPASVALVHCAGAPDGTRMGACSVVCCMAMAKYAQQLAQKLPETTIHELLWERSTPGKGYLEFASASRAAAHGRLKPIRLEPTERVSVEQARISQGSGAGSRRRRTTPNLVLRFRSGGKGPARRPLRVEMVVLAPPLSPSASTDRLAHLIGVEVGQGGFVLEPGPKVAPYQSSVDGILVAGCATGPKDIRAASAEGAAAAGRALSSLVPGRKLELEPYRAAIDPEHCSGCKTCVVVCPFGAVRFDPELRVAQVEQRLCQGCGSCAARCPVGVATAPGFTDGQLLAEIAGLLG